MFSLQFAILETVVSALVDEFQEYLKEKKLHLTLGLSILFFLLGLPQCTQVGYVNMIKEYVLSYDHNIRTCVVSLESNHPEMFQDQM